MFSVPLSVTICNGVLCLGMISSGTRWTTVSALLSGTAKASGQPLYQSTKLITGGSHLSCTAVKPDSHLAQIFFCQVSLYN